MKRTIRIRGSAKAVGAVERRTASLLKKAGNTAIRAMDLSGEALNETGRIEDTRLGSAVAGRIERAFSTLDDVGNELKDIARLLT